MILHSMSQAILYAAQRHHDLMQDAQQRRMALQAAPRAEKPCAHQHLARLATIVATLVFALILALSGVAFMTMRMQAAPVHEEPPANQLYLPLIAKAGVNVPTATPMPTNQPTEAPTATPTTAPTETPPPDSVVNSLFVETAWKTTNADIQVDANGGMHMAYAYYEPNTGVPPIGAVYLYCAGQCEQGANWHNVWFEDEVNEVQLALTPAGQPRLLMRTSSTVQVGGRDYQYAECNANCTAPENWTVTLLLTSYGTDIFDIGDDDLPQRSFAVDPQGNPTFLYLDRNYPIEPDHYGFYYVKCDGGCSDATHWTQTLVTAVIQEEYVFDWEVAEYPSLTFTTDGRPRFIAELMLLGDQDRDTALYYFACDSGCDDRANWGRVKIGERGQGSDLSWDLALDANDRPRVAHYPAALPDEQGDRLWYVWCDADCLVESNWQRVNLGLPANDGQEPDIELDANGNPRIAHADDSSGGLGYSWCNGGCESASNWQHTTVESADQLYQYWPVAYPLSCDGGLWSGLTPSLALDAAGNPRIAYDVTYHARCLYQDPARPDDPPDFSFHLIMRSARGVYFAQP